MNHVDKVHYDDSADVAQSKLSNKFFGCLKVVLGNRLFEVSAGSDEFSSVHINNCHGFGAINNQGTSGGKKNLSVQSFDNLIPESIAIEHILACGELNQTFN